MKKLFVFLFFILLFGGLYTALAISGGSWQPLAVGTELIRIIILVAKFVWFSIIKPILGL